MTSNEHPCVVLGPVGFHRLAHLLFEYPVHVLLDGERWGMQTEAFAHKNYLGQPISYIQDDLETRLLDYRLAAKLAFSHQR